MKNNFLASILAAAVIFPTIAVAQTASDPYFDEASRLSAQMDSIESQVTQIRNELDTEKQEIESIKQFFDTKKAEAEIKFQTIDGYRSEYEKAKESFASTSVQNSEQELALKNALTEMEIFKAIFDEAQQQYLISGGIRSVALSKQDQATSFLGQGESILSQMSLWANPSQQVSNIQSNIRQKYNSITQTNPSLKSEIETFTQDIKRQFNEIEAAWKSDGGIGTQNGIAVMYQEADTMVAKMQCELFAINLENPQSQNRYREDILFPSWRRGNNDPEALCENLAEGTGITGVIGETNDGNLFFNLIPNLTTLIFRVAAPIILVSLIIIGIRFIYAGQFGGSYEEDIEKSKQYLRNVVVGVIIMVLSYSVIRAVYNLFVQ